MQRTISIFIVIHHVMHGFSFVRIFLESSNSIIKQLLTHEVSQADMKKISSEILSDVDRNRVYNILSKFPNRRDLARCGYYEKPIT